MNFELFKDGVLIMIIGMGTVYFFLGIMIYVMEWSSKFMQYISKYFPEEVEKETRPKNNTKNNDEEIALAVACAIKEGAKHAK